MTNIILNFNVLVWGQGGGTKSGQGGHHPSRFYVWGLCPLPKGLQPLLPQPPNLT